MKYEQEEQSGTISTDYETLEKMNAVQLTKQASQESLAARLRRQKTQAEAEVARLAELIQLLEANPSTERILQLLGR